MQRNVFLAILSSAALTSGGSVAQVPNQTNPLRPSDHPGIMSPSLEAPGRQNAPAGAAGSAAGTRIAPGSVGREAATEQLQIVIATTDGEVRCTPSNVRLAAQTSLTVEVANRADKPLWFVAPEFFRRADLTEPRGHELDTLKGGFLVAPRSAMLVRLTTPDPGQYYYSCSELGQAPNPLSSGVLVVAR